MFQTWLYAKLFYTFTGVPWSRAQFFVDGRLTKDEKVFFF